MNRILIACLLLFLPIITMGQTDLLFLDQDGVEVSSYSRAPYTGESTHFGNLALGETKSITIRIRNDYSGFLSFLGVDIGQPTISGLDPNDYQVIGPALTYLGYGQETTIEIEFSPQNKGVRDARISFTPRVAGIFALAEVGFYTRGLVDVPFLNVYSQAGEIISRNSPAEASLGTDFGEVTSGQSAVNTFELRNEGADNLTINSLLFGPNSGSISGEFGLVNSLTFPITIVPGSSRSFQIRYSPLDDIADDLNFGIESDDELGVYQFGLTGRLFNPSATEIMMAQVYENGRQNDFIEVINTSESVIQSSTYFVASYRDGERLDRAPRRARPIPSLQPGQVHVIDNLEIRGNEVLIISSSRGRDSYANRVDIIGEQGVNWGRRRSFIKGCYSESAHIIYDPAHWIPLTTDQVDQASSLTNLYEGVHQLGPIIWDGNGWTGGQLPDFTRQAIVQGNYPQAFETIEVCDLVVNATMNFDAGSTRSLIIHRDLDVQGSLIIGDHESLITHHEQATITGSITKIERSTFRNNTHDFTYWGSPVSNASVSSVFDGVNPSRIFYYDQSQTSSSDPSSPDYWSTWQYAAGTMEPGRGYAAEGREGDLGVHEVHFTGRPNNGTLVNSVDHWNDTDLDNDFNLLSNPYPSAIDIELFFDVNSSVIDPTVYLWTHSTPVSGGSSGDYSKDDYATYNYSGGVGVGNGPVPDKNIGSSQGFFMRSIANGSVTFTNSMRMKEANDQFYKETQKKEALLVDKSSKDRIWLKLTTDKGGYNQLLLGFFDKATEGYDLGYDALKFKSSNVISFYSMMDEKKLSIQAHAPLKKTKEIQLGFTTSVAPRTMKIEVEEVEGRLLDTELWLFDKESGDWYDLKSHAYEFFQQEVGEFSDRFILRFDPPEINEELLDEESENIKIYSSEGQFRVTSPELIEKVEVYDVLGRRHYSSSPNSTSFELNIRSIHEGEILLFHCFKANGQVELQKAISQ